MPNTTPPSQWLKWISAIQAIAQSGLAYSDNPFDRERYVQLMELVSEMAAACSNTALEEINSLFSIEKGYATPKIDVRAFILEKDKVLLAKERSDGLWTLPGGWADVNDTPSGAVIRETKEETGYEVAVTKLLAFWDKLKHEHPPRWPHVYKCFFHCKILSGEAQSNLEIAEVDFFDINHLPPLSVHRVTAKQLERLHQLALFPEPTQFD